MSKNKLNRRGILKGIGALLLMSPIMLQHVLAARTSHYWPRPGEDTPEGLRIAIEALFQSGATSNTAMAEAKNEGDYVYKPEYVLIPQVYGIAYILTKDSEKNVRLHRAIYQAMYKTFVSIAALPETKGAVLFWRKTPFEMCETDFESRDSIVRLQLRASCVKLDGRSATS